MSALIISVIAIVICLFLHAAFQAYESGLLRSDLTTAPLEASENGSTSAPTIHDSKRIVSIQSTCVLVTFWTASAIAIERSGISSPI